MKPYTYALLAVAAACGVASAQTSATTTPVGYITHTINNAAGAESLTLIGPSLIQPTEFAGAAAASPSGKTITFAGGVPTTLGSSYVLEISNGNQEGWWSTVTSSTANSITVNDDFPAGLAADVKISVRKHNTLRTFLGSNAAGLTPFDGVSQADEVQIISASQPGQPLTSYSFVPASVSGEAQDSWYDLGSSTNADNVVIEPGTSVLVKQFGSSNKTFTSVGEVKISKTQFDVFPGLNFIANPVAVGATLNGLGFNSQLNTFDGANTDADEVQVIGASGGLTAYAALDASLGLGSTMYNLGDSSDAGAVVVPEGTGALIKRAATKPATTITLPGTVVGQ